jgi:hypothetical protein
VVGIFALHGSDPAAHDVLTRLSLDTSRQVARLARQALEQL